MAGKKKKTKPIANPARGFATTSIASKPKAEADALETPPNNSEATSTPTNPISAPSDDDGRPASVARATDAKELHELSPEELEKELLLSELQNIIEQFGPRVRKESARQVSRLQTDKRVLRTQAESLSTKEWLGEELVQQIVEAILEDSSLSSSSNPRSTISKRGSEEDTLARVWQLYLTLRELDISEELVRNVLRHVLMNPPSDEGGLSYWGLAEAFEWLALHSDQTNWLEYDAAPSRQQMSHNRQFEADAPGTDTIPSDGSENQTTRTTARGNNAGKDATEANSSMIDDITVSDIDSDLEPDEMISTYLRTKARLFERDPSLVDGKSSKKVHSSKASNGFSSPSKPTPGEMKLQLRLTKLENDVLFDKRIAESIWAEQKVEMLQDRAERRRLHLDSNRQASSSTPTATTSSPVENNAGNDVMAEAERAANELLKEIDDDEVGISGMFGDLNVEPDANQTSNNAESVSEPGLVVRNFGRLTGMTPRRIFEDACKSRDPGVKVHYKMVSPTTYNSRHAVSVVWSRAQDVIASPTSISDVLMSYRSEREITITMTKIATPETIQSEGYVSTAALFIIFNGSPKEEKASLRLPPAFRDLWQEFVDAKRKQDDAEDREIVKSLREIIREHTSEELDEDVVLTAGFRNRNKNMSGVSTPVNGEKQDVRGNMGDSQALKEMWMRKTATPAYQHMLVARSNLPMFQFRDTALATVEHNQVTILCGETGCGKSTQMPAFILENELSHGRHCKIYCTEPRRISAISLAQRVSEEMGDERGAVGTSRSLVGYAIRLESHTTAQTRLVYATVGIVLRMLESARGIDEVTHLVIDEIHERSIDTDFLLIVLRTLMARRPDLKVVLMSATVDAQLFSAYLDNAPIVTVPGRTFPVQAKFLEDAIELTGHTNEDGPNNGRAEDDDDDFEAQSDSKSVRTGNQLSEYSPRTIKTLSSYDEYKIDYSLMVKLLEKIACDPRYNKFSQAILVFLPGIAEIRQLNDILSGHPSFSHGWLIYPLHSSFSSEEQQAAFQIPPPGMRKVILATNIAETGITIPDCTAVIDCGRHKEMRFDERRQLSRLIQSFISRANAKQRRGRAGRVQEGICFHLFTKYRHDEIMAEQQTPEMLRLSLQDLVMRVKICNLGEIENALSQALDPPSLKNIRRAIDALIDVGALTSTEELTPLGNQLAKLPLDAQLGKLILLASVFGCLDFGLTVAATLSSKSPFLSPMNAKKQADTIRLGFQRGDSDLLTTYNAYTTWRKVCTTAGSSEFQFCRKNFLSPQNLANIEDLKSQLLSSLADAGFVSLEAAEKAALSRVRRGGRQRTFVTVPAKYDAGDTNDLLLNSVTAWSFYPKVLSRDGKGWRNVANNQAISLHPQSVNKGSALEAKFISFYSIMQSAARFTNAQETSPVEAMALIMLAGDAVFNMYAGVIVIDGNRLRFKVGNWKTMMVLKTLRSRMKEILAKTMRNPGRALGERQSAWMEMFMALFERAQQKTVEKANGRPWR